MNDPKPNDGGPAFPLHLPAIASEPDTYWNGMSLRDYFAGQILQGVITTANGLGTLEKQKRQEMLKQMSELIYEVADAMIAARNS